MLKINSIQYSLHLTLWILVLLAVGACSSLRKPSVDGPPTVNESAENVPAEAVADAIPRQEPLSKYGNPPSYEVFGKTYHTLKSSHGFVQRGIASWYGKKFHGRRTSSGEPYDMYGMTAAHTQLPLPTYVQVTNLKNGKQVILRVNDRGPFHGNRVIDLSYTAARKLDIVKEGTGLVEVRALDAQNYQSRNNRSTQESEIRVNDAASDPLDNHQQADIQTEVPAVISEVDSIEVAREDSVIAVSEAGPQVFVQVGAFGDRDNADQLKNQLSQLNLGQVTVSSIVKNAKQLHRVRIGPMATVQSADDAVTELNSMGLSDHSVVIE